MNPSAFHSGFEEGAPLIIYAKRSPKICVIISEFVLIFYQLHL